MSRIVRFHELGGPEVLKIEEHTFGDPGRGELRIRVQAIEKEESCGMIRISSAGIARLRLLPMP